MARGMRRHASRLSMAHEGALDQDFSVGQRVRTPEGMTGRVLFVTESFSPGLTAYQIQLDNGMGGGAYLGSQLRPLPESFRGLPGYSNLPAGVAAYITEEQARERWRTSAEAQSGQGAEDYLRAQSAFGLDQSMWAEWNEHARQSAPHTDKTMFDEPDEEPVTHAHEDYPELGDILHKRPDPAHQVRVIGSRHTALFAHQVSDEELLQHMVKDHVATGAENIASHERSGTMAPGTLRQLHDALHDHPVRDPHNREDDWIGAAGTSTNPEFVAMRKTAAMPEPYGDTWSTEHNQTYHPGPMPPIFHGTNHPSQPGWSIEPGHPTHYPEAYEDDEHLRYVHATPHLEQAWQHADNAVYEHGGSHHVYEVKPTGRVTWGDEAFPEDFEDDDDMNRNATRMSEYPFQVIREVPYRGERLPFTNRHQGAMHIATDLEAGGVVPVDEHGDAPQHGLIPRAEDPDAYDEESTEGLDDPLDSDDQERKRTDAPPTSGANGGGDPGGIGGDGGEGAVGGEGAIAKVPWTEHERTNLHNFDPAPTATWGDFVPSGNFGHPLGDVIDMRHEAVSREMPEYSDPREIVQHLNYHHAIEPAQTWAAHQRGELEQLHRAHHDPRVSFPGHMPLVEHHHDPGAYPQAGISYERYLPGTTSHPEHPGIDVGDVGTPYEALAEDVATERQHAGLDPRTRVMHTLSSRHKAVSERQYRAHLQQAHGWTEENLARDDASGMRAQDRHDLLHSRPGLSDHRHQGGADTYAEQLAAQRREEIARGWGKALRPGAREVRDSALYGGYLPGTTGPGGYRRDPDIEERLMGSEPRRARDPETEMNWAERARFYSSLHEAGPRAFMREAAFLEIMANPSQKSNADAVFGQLAEDYPVDSMAWIHHVAWSGPHWVPFDDIDWDGRHGWNAYHQPARYEEFKPKVLKKLKKGKEPKPVILVQRPGLKDQRIIDGHHRSITELLLGQKRNVPGVWAWTGHVHAPTGPWDEFHAKQFRADHSTDTGYIPGDDGSTKPEVREFHAMIEDAIARVHGHDGKAEPEFSDLADSLDYGHKIKKTKDEKKRDKDEEKAAKDGGGGGKNQGLEPRRKIPNEGNGMVDNSVDSAQEVPQRSRAWTQGRKPEDVRRVAAKGQFQSDRTSAPVSAEEMRTRCTGCGKKRKLTMVFDPEAAQELRYCSECAAKISKKASFRMFTEAARSPSFGFEFTAAWRDVVSKAKRLKEAGRVRITAAAEGYVIGEVGGDHDVYESGLQHYPGRPQSIFAWACGCPWASFHQDKSLGTRYAGRPCSHVMALKFEEQARRMFGDKLRPDPEIEPYLGHEVVVKSLPPWGPGGWNKTWTAPSTIAPFFGSVHQAHELPLQHQHPAPLMMEGYPLPGDPNINTPVLNHPFLHGFGKDEESEEEESPARKAASLLLSTGVKKKAVRQLLRLAEHIEPDVGRPWDENRDEVPEAGQWGGTDENRGWYGDDGERHRVYEDAGEMLEHTRQYHPVPPAHLSMRVEADQANAPWGSDNLAPHPPVKPYGATEPPKKEMSPGSYGPLSGPDPDNWGEINENSILQDGAGTGHDAALHQGASRNFWTHRMPEIRAWHERTAPSERAIARMNRVGSPYKEGFAYIGDGGHWCPECKRGRERLGEDTSDMQPISWAELSHHYPSEGTSCSDCTDELTGPRRHTDRECDNPSECQSALADLREEAKGVRGGPDERDAHQEYDQERLHWAENGMEEDTTAPPHSEHESDPQEDWNAELMEHHEWSRKLKQRTRDEAAAAHQINQMFREHPGHEFFSQSALHQAAENSGFHLTPNLNLPAIGDWQPEREGTTPYSDQANIAGPSTSITPRDPGGIRMEEALERAIRLASGEEPYRAEDPEDHLQHFHSWNPGDSDRLRSNGIDPAEYHRYMHRTYGEAFAVPHEHFGMSERDQSELRDLGIREAAGTASPSDPAAPQLMGGLGAELHDKPEPALDPEGVTGADTPMGGGNAAAAPGMNQTTAPATLGEWGASRRANLRARFSTGVVPTENALEPSATGGGPGMSMHDEDLSAWDEPSIQTVGQQQWSGGGSDSDEVAVESGMPGASEQAIIAAFQASQGARQFTGGGSVRGNGDIAKAAAHFLRTGEILTDAEAHELIVEGQGTRARNLDLLDLDGTHYTEQDEAMKRRGLSLDDFDDDLVAM